MCWQGLNPAGQVGINEVVDSVIAAKVPQAGDALGAGLFVDDFADNIVGGAWVGVFGYDVVKDVLCSWGVCVADVVVVTIFGIWVKDMFGDGIDVVGKLATGQCHIHACSVNGLVDDRAGDIHGCALGAIDGGSVTELNVFAHIVCREVFDMTFIVGGDDASIVANISQSQ